MLKDFVVVTFAGTHGSNIHREYQREFDRLYGDRFLAHVDWTSDMLQGTKYYNDHMSLFQYKKYFGYFLWKPYIILDALETFNAPVLYCDSNLRFKDIDRFESKMDEWLQKQYLFLPKCDHYYNYEWTKRDTFIWMDADDEFYWNAKQRWTILFAVSNTSFGIRFMKEYQQYCEIPGAVIESPNVMNEPNLPGFKEHRWEQSIMSILAEKYGIDGPTDVEMLHYYDKVYSPELMKYKEEINNNPLERI